MEQRRQPEPELAARMRGTWRLWLALAISLGVVVADLVWHPVFADLRRTSAGLIGAALLLVLAGGDRKSIGLRLVPAQGWGYWIKASIAVGVILSAVIGVAAGVLYLAGKPLPMRSMFTDPSQFRPVGVHAVVVAPLLEEPIYRLVLCVPLVALGGRWVAVIVSGGAFGYLHFHYGNPSPDNFFAGYVLAWAFLHSRSIVVPIALHAIGNGIVIAGHIAAFYFL